MTGYRKRYPLNPADSDHGAEPLRKIDACTRPQGTMTMRTCSKKNRTKSARTPEQGKMAAKRMFKYAKLAREHSSMYAIPPSQGRRVASDLSSLKTKRVAPTSQTPTTLDKKNVPAASDATASSSDSQSSTASIDQWSGSRLTSMLVNSDSFSEDPGMATGIVVKVVAVSAILVAVIVTCLLVILRKRHLHSQKDSQGRRRLE
ncbi:hypothetical protein EDB81DRAFT_761947 [Dactylonectria macrodidyma]|uniref:Uncharacterized protein n=1 Tax=Dactylonectria macrodidyma TaxID=307937 RepID=A0A9P9EGQ3_9HYPO|nr:hypothetical protein EDB81DRAFT_761947 [Dactylonectria macrodidyma]